MEAKLIQDKFLNNSDSATWVFVRPPSTDVGDAVKVNLGINYFRLKHIDEKSGQLTASFFETRVSGFLSWTFIVTIPDLTPPVRCYLNIILSQWYDACPKKIQFNWSITYGAPQTHFPLSSPGQADHDAADLHLNGLPANLIFMADVNQWTGERDFSVWTLMDKLAVLDLQQWSCWLIALSLIVNVG